MKYVLILSFVAAGLLLCNIPQAEAVDRLVDLIREHNKWVEPEEKEAVASH